MPGSYCTRCGASLLDCKCRRRPNDPGQERIDKLEYALRRLLDAWDARNNSPGQVAAAEWRAALDAAKERLQSGGCRPMSGLEVELMTEVMQLREAAQSEADQVFVYAKAILGLRAALRDLVEAGDRHVQSYLSDSLRAALDAAKECLNGR